MYQIIWWLIFVIITCIILFIADYFDKNWSIENDDDYNFHVVIKQNDKKNKN